MPVIQNETALTLDNIVVATDFSPESEKALAYARALARQFASRITLANVVDLSAVPFPDTVVGLPLDELRRNSAENLERILYNLGIEGISAQSKSIESNSPAHAVVDLAQEVDADLIIVGTHSRHGLSKLMLGSCSEGIIRSATCPVLTIGPNADPDPVDVNLHSILFATDLRHDAVEKAAVALAFAKEHIADVHICHIIEDKQESFADAFREQTSAESALARLIPDASYDWCNPKPSVHFGNVDQEILKLAKDKHADLIVLGAHRSLKWLNRFWDGVAEEVIRHAECPVLTICTC